MSDVQQLDARQDGKHSIVLYVNPADADKVYVPKGAKIMWQDRIVPGRFFMLVKGKGVYGFEV